MTNIDMTNIELRESGITIQKAINQNSQPRRRDLFVVLWTSLGRPWLLITVASINLLLALAAEFLPQLPGQYVHEPAVANRWLLTTSAEHGVLGPVLNGLGLFNVLHSLALRIGLAALGMLLLIQLGDLLARGLRMRQLPAILHLPDVQPGSPLPIPGSAPIYRSLSVKDAGPEEVAAQLESQLTTIQQNTGGSVSQAVLPVVKQGGDLETSEDSGVEHRWLLMDNPWLPFLRALLIAGILLALGVTWLGANFGWEVAPPLLAPGGQFSFPARDLVVHYQLPETESALNSDAENQWTPALQVQLGEAVGELVVSQKPSMRLGNVTVRAEAASPGLLLATVDGKPILALPGENDSTSRIGFAFPAPGSEQSVLLPEANAGLRIVRLDSPDQGKPSFLVEVFHSGSNEAVERLTVEKEQRIDVPLPDGVAPLYFAFAPSMNVRIRYLPGNWLLWPALAMILVGLASYLRRSFFLLVQLAPWPTDRAVLIAQTDSEAMLAKLKTAHPEGE